MTQGRRRRYCQCGCGKRLDTIPGVTKRRQYFNVAHRQRAARRRGWRPPLRTHEVTLKVGFTTQGGKLVGISTQVLEPNEHE